MLIPAIALWTLKDFLLLFLLFSAVYRMSARTCSHLSLLVVASPGNSPSNTSGLLLLLGEGANLAADVADGLRAHSFPPPTT